MAMSGQFQLAAGGQMQLAAHTQSTGLDNSFGHSARYPNCTDIIRDEGGRSWRGRGGETDRLKVLEEQADWGRGRAAGSAHRVIDAGDRADVVNSACQWLHHVILPGVGQDTPETGNQ